MEVKEITFTKDFDSLEHAQSFANKKYANENISKVKHTITKQMINGKIRYVLTSYKEKEVSKQMNLF